MKTKFLLLLCLLITARTWSAPTNLPTAGTSGVITDTNGLLTGPSTNFFPKNTGSLAQALSLAGIGGVTNFNGLTGKWLTLSLGTAGNDFGILSAGTNTQFNLPVAGTNVTGKLSSNQWSTLDYASRSATNQVVTNTAVQAQIAALVTTNVNQALTNTSFQTEITGKEATNVAALKANNGSDFASRLLTASNIGTITISNQAQLPAQPNLSGITGKYPGQPLVTYGGGAGGGGLHSLYFWNTNGGVANWDGGIQIPGPLVASSSGANNHLLIVSNGTDNVLELRNLDPAHYSAMRFTDRFGGEAGAIGWGNTNAIIYPGIDYFEDYGTQYGIYFVGNGKLYFGEEASTGDLVRNITGATNASPTNVVFRVDGTGGIKASGAVALNTLTVSNNATLGSIAGAAVTLAGTNITVGTGGTGNSANGSFGRLRVNLRGDICSSALSFGDNFAQGVDGSGNFLFGWCFGTIGTNVFIDATTHNMWMGKPLAISNTGTTGVITLPAAGTILELNSTNLAFLLPRMTKVQRNAISTQVAGMMVFQTDNTPGLRVYNGTSWMRYTETAG